MNNYSYYLNYKSLVKKNLVEFGSLGLKGSEGAVKLGYRGGHFN